MENKKNTQEIIDYITGKRIPDIGAEVNRQAVERYLVDTKGYSRENIRVDMELSLEIGGKPYRTCLDLVIFIDERPFMIIKCAAGSLDSREREVISSAQVLYKKPVPCAVASDGKDALVYDAIEKKLMGQGLDRIPGPGEARSILEQKSIDPLPIERLEKEKIIFRSYDIMNVNVCRP